MMNITINEEAVAVSKGITIKSLLQSLNFSEKASLIVAVNDKKVPSSQWKEKIILEEDVVMIITVPKGG